MSTILQVNGAQADITTHPRAPLLWALRDELGCASVKYGCGAEQCGACRVLVDGVPTSSCAITIEEVAGRETTTLERLVAEGRADAVVGALTARNAGQCGFCLPGIVCSLVALAERSPEPPADDDLLRVLDDHLCRCGSQPRILAAARAALGSARTDG